MTYVMFDYRKNVFVIQYAPRSNKVNQKNGCVCETLMPLAASKSKLAILSIKIMVKFTGSLNLKSFERVSLVEEACQI